MSARIVNLRTRRRQIARDAKRKAVNGGPAPGISKAERARAAADNRRERERLEGLRREDDT